MLERSSKGLLLRDSLVRKKERFQDGISANKRNHYFYNEGCAMCNSYAA
jgi:hypothetical protein